MNSINLYFLSLFLIALIPKDSKDKKWRAECDVSHFYEASIPDIGLKILNSYGDLEEPQLILSPIDMKVGTYKVQLTRKGDDLYKLEGTSYYIETSSCYEYIYYEEAILKVVSHSGYSFGTVYID